MKKLIKLFSDYRTEQERSRRLDAVMIKALIDPYLIERILAGPVRMPDIEEEPLDLSEAPLFKPRSIDGILHYAI